MLRPALVIILGLVASIATAACPSGCGNVCDCARPEYRFYFIPGPELTGDYARPYLYSCDTDRWYADPAFYRAQAAAASWNARQGRGRTATQPGRAQLPSYEQQMRVVTSRHIPAIPRTRPVVEKGAREYAPAPVAARPTRPADYSIDK